MTADPNRRPAGTAILCANGHEVARLVRDLEVGEINWGTAFEWFQDDQPVFGSEYEPMCAQCGGKIFNKHWQVRTIDGLWPQLGVDSSGE